MRRHLPGDADERDGIHQGIRQPGDGICRPRPRGHQNHPDLAGRTRITFRGMHRAAFLAHEDVLDFLLLEHFVIDRQHRAAWISEHMLDALID